MNLYGIIGFPLSHSFSPAYFNNKFSQIGFKDYSYQAFPLEHISLLPHLLQTQKNLKGFNITIPYKELIVPYLHHPNNIVQAIGACNCVSIKNNLLFGFNTDVIGFEESLKPLLKPHHKKALILGSGGAAKAVQYILQQNHIDFLSVSRKSISSPKTISYQNLSPNIIQQHTLIINTTPLGMAPFSNQAPPIPYHFLSTEHLCYDLIYNPPLTPFLQKSEKQGATIKNGYDMLILQAEAAWKIWNP